jgi:ATP-dependent DNA helicase DinG
MANDLKLDPQKLLKYLQDDGPLSVTLKGYEPREQQQQMLLNVTEAYNVGSIALVEAGTGTGKSLAYLIPAIAWALKNKEKTLISTNTINLQEQLMLKDIPLVTKTLGINVKAVLVKGMSNYLCLRKLKDATFEINLLPSEDSPLIQKISAWSTTTPDGSRSTLPFSVQGETWEKVNAEADTCTRQDCPYFSQCFFIKARKEAEDAQLLISNHHMLFADLSMKMMDEDNAGLLPQYERIIIDEAHNIEDVATEFFADRASRLSILHILGRLMADKPGQTGGKLNFLRTILFNIFKKNIPADIMHLISRFEIDIPGARNDLSMTLVECFQSFENFMSEQYQKAFSDIEETKFRLRNTHYSDTLWKEKVLPPLQRFLDSLQRYCTEIEGVLKGIDQLGDEKVTEQTKSVIVEITALKNRLVSYGMILSRLVSGTENPNLVRWIETQKRNKATNTELIDAELDISQRIIDALFSRYRTVILCSATLTTDRKFEFIKDRLGLNSEQMSSYHITENIYDSPFNYPKQALLVVPTDIPKPNHPNFNDSAIFQIWQAIQTSRGNAFVLFTSYSMLMECYNALASKLKADRYHVFKQGDEQRHFLLEKFKKTDRSVLFGTDSFWEGVDVVGDALRCVILAKLPFKAPNDPIIQARAEAIEQRGGDPFMEYAVPQAIVKFKQGFGRLIRNKNDRGCVVCLDTRLTSTGYGRKFLNSLPNCPQIFSHSNKIKEEMEAFYKRTYFLVTNKVKH